MEDLSPSELRKTVKFEFSRRCGHFQQILAHMGEDFITRYSAKAQPHPDFFKEDASTSRRQFTLYADQCIQAMRKFAFMESPAAILSTLITSLLKVNEYLAKQLYHHLKILRPQHTSLITETLCSSCSKLRQNEKVRALRDELELNKTGIFVPKVMHQIVTRKGQKYDVEQLLQEQIENLQSLNEDEVRKRLAKLQLDHDKRKQDMVVCIQELGRANQRLTSYSRAVEKKGKDQNKFNIKQYVFQISRHFYHNIASLQQKIKLLKQGLNPMIDSQSQTELAYVLLSSHQQLANQNALQISRLKSYVHDLQTHLTVQQRKNKEYVQNCFLLQEKLRQTQVQRDRLKINEKVSQSQLKGSIAQYQNKNQNLEKMVKKLKSSTKLRQIDRLEHVESQGSQLWTAKTLNKSEHNIQDDSNQGEGVTSKQQKKVLKSCLTSKKSQTRESFLNLHLFQKIDQLQEQNREKLSNIGDLSQYIKRAFSQMHQQNKDRLRIERTLEQSFQWNLPKKQPIKRNISRERFSLYNIELKNIRDSYQEKDYLCSKNTINDRNSEAYQTLSKFTKKSIYQIAGKASNKLTSIKSKENVIFAQREQASLDTQEKQYSLFDPLRPKIQLKKSIDLVKSKSNVCFHQKGEAAIKQKYPLIRPHLGYLQKSKKKVNKQRNLSQQNSLEQSDQIDNVRRSIDKLVTKDTNIFSEEDNKVLLFLKNAQSQLKLMKKNPIYKPENHKAVLSLQQINYSTYFYSLIAKLHLKNPVAYANLKKMLSVIPIIGNEEDCVKNSLNALITNHRKCKGGGAICSHLEHFLEKVKNL